MPQAPNLPISTSEKSLRFFGKWIATPFFAIGSSIMTAVATASLSFIASLTLPWVITVLSLVFLAEATVSIYFFKNSVPDTLSACFVHNVFKDLSRPKKVLLGFGILAAIGSGLALGALTFVSSTTAMATILGLFSFSCPPLGIALASVLGIAGFLCLTALFINYIEMAIRKDIHLKIMNFFKENFKWDEGKSRIQKVLEVSFKIFFLTVIIGMTVIGMIATLGTFQGGLASFLSLIPNADGLAIQISSSIIVYGLMGAARLPWLLSSACSAMSSLGEAMGKKLYQLVCNIGYALGLVEANMQASNQAQPPQENSSWKAMGISFLKLSAITIHGFSFGALARSGGGHVLSDLIKNFDLPINAASLQILGETTALVTQGTVQAAVSANALFGQRKKEDIPKTNEGSEPGSQP